MSKKRNLYLVVVHSKHVKMPTSVEILSNPAFEKVVREAMAQCKHQGDVKKQIAKIARANAKDITMEQVFLTDNHSHNRISSASIIIDVDKRSIIKNRFETNSPQEMIDLYIQKYADKIKEFNDRFRK